MFWVLIAGPRNRRSIAPIESWRSNTTPTAAKPRMPSSDSKKLPKRTKCSTMPTNALAMTSMATRVLMERDQPIQRCRRHFRSLRRNVRWRDVRRSCSEVEEDADDDRAAGPTFAVMSNCQLDEAAKGVSKDITFRRNVACSRPVKEVVPPQEASRISLSTPAVDAVRWSNRRESSECKPLVRTATEQDSKSVNPA